eukprot:1194632-Prorocentrum_minimum.AAC.4
MLVAGLADLDVATEEVPQVSCTLGAWRTSAPAGAGGPRPPGPPAANTMSLSMSLQVGPPLRLLIDGLI